MQAGSKHGVVEFHTRIRQIPRLNSKSKRYKVIAVLNWLVGTFGTKTLPGPRRGYWVPRVLTACIILAIVIIVRFKEMY